MSTPLFIGFIQATVLLDLSLISNGEYEIIVSLFIYCSNVHFLGSLQPRTHMCILWEENIRIWQGF